MPRYSLGRSRGRQAPTETGSKSSWVTRELEIALARNQQASRVRIIPIRLDGSPIPATLSEFRYVDLYADYHAGIRTLVALLSADVTSQLSPVTDLIDPDKMAEGVAQEQQGFTGSGYLATTVLGILTIVVTLIAAIPAFYTAFAQRSRVYYSVSRHDLIVPDGVDKAALKAVMKANNMPDSTLRVQFVNKGEIAAKEIKTSITTPGAVVSASSLPTVESQPIWVGINIERNVTSRPNQAFFTLTSLVPERTVSLLVGFDSSGSEKELVDVVSDGLEAELVPSIEQVPSWSYWRFLERPLIILGLGIFLTLFVGFVAVFRSNSQVRSATLLLAKELNPTLARIVDAALKTMR